MDLTRITVEPLGRQHDRTAFHCGSKALDRYLKQQAWQDADKRVAAPFVAVDQATKGQGLGEHLLLDALNRSLTHADQIAAMAVVVDAKDESAASFYRRFGFIALQAEPSRLFLPMRLVAQLLG